VRGRGRSQKTWRPTGNGKVLSIRLVPDRDELNGSHGRLLVRVEKVTVVRCPPQALGLWRAFARAPRRFFLICLEIYFEPAFRVDAPWRKGSSLRVASDGPGAEMLQGEVGVPCWRTRMSRTACNCQIATLVGENPIGASHVVRRAAKCLEIRPAPWGSKALSVRSHEACRAGNCLEIASQQPRSGHLTVERRVPRKARRPRGVQGSPPCAAAADRWSTLRALIQRHHFRNQCLQVLNACLR